MNRLLVSIILPSYNRARFLPEALDAIRQQALGAWELIVVDDGSTDDTRQVLETQTRDWPQPVRYIHQDNAGAYAARNTGIEQALRGSAPYLAFYDSDDLWLPHHLEDAVAALQSNPDVDWVYAPARRIELDTGRVLGETNFVHDDQPHPLLKLRARAAGPINIFDDPDTVRCGIEHNLCCLLQTSVMRRHVFEGGRRFVADDRNEGEDELFPLRAMKAGFALAYFRDVHLIYRTHAENASAAAQGMSMDKRLRITAAAARGYEALADQIDLNPAEERARRRRLANEYFWKRGYAILWQGGRRRQAMAELRRGLAWWPWSAGMWKSYLACKVRQVTERAQAPEGGAGL